MTPRPFTRVAVGAERAGDGDHAADNRLDRPDSAGQPCRVGLRLRDVTLLGRVPDLLSSAGVR